MHVITSLSQCVNEVVYLLIGQVFLSIINQIFVFSIIFSNLKGVQRILNIASNVIPRR